MRTDGRTDEQTDMTSPICIHFMHFVQRTHKKCQGVKYLRIEFNEEIVNIDKPFDSLLSARNLLAV
jgi:hypothetical protein